MIQSELSRPVAWTCWQLQAWSQVFCALGVVKSTWWAKAKKILRIIFLQRKTKVATKKRDNEITLNMFIGTSTRWEQGTLIKILTSRILKTEQRLGNSNILLVSALVSKYVSCIQHIWSVSEVTPHALFLSDLEVIMLRPRFCCKKKSNHLRQDTALVTWRQNGEDCLRLPMSKKFNKQWHYVMISRHFLQQSSYMPADLAKKHNMCVKIKTSYNEWILLSSSKECLP